MPDEIAAGLAETIAALRLQLANAQAAGKGGSLQFRLGEIEVEFQVAITKDASADGGVRFGVISFGAKGGLAQASTHRIALRMQPVELRNGQLVGPAMVGDHVVNEPE
jgi:NTP-dependent ternary system trypsin peptidase co-occuring protein